MNTVNGEGHTHWQKAAFQKFMITLPAAERSRVTPKMYPMKQVSRYPKNTAVRKGLKPSCFRNAALLIALFVWQSALAVPGFSPDLVDRSDADGTVKSASVLMSPGNDLFGTIQEVIRQLEAEPGTDWSRVNLEVLRSHLRDMFEFSHNVDVLSEQPIDQGVRVVVTPLTQRTQAALDRVLAAHPRILKNETGWDMRVNKSATHYEIITTTSQNNQIDKIRGLGYIGLMTYGMHHQPHHWAMATGKHPHQHRPH